MTPRAARGGPPAEARGLGGEEEGGLHLLQGQHAAGAPVEPGLHRVGQGRRGGEAQRGLSLHRAGTGGDELGGPRDRPRTAAVDRRRRPRQHLAEGRAGWTRVRGPPRGQVVQRGAERVDIGAGVDPVVIAAGLLRGHVGGVPKTWPICVASATARSPRRPSSPGSTVPNTRANPQSRT